MNKTKEIENVQTALQIPVTDINFTDKGVEIVTNDSYLFPHSKRLERKKIKNSTQ
jgi:hypothetical protein